MKNSKGAFFRDVYEVVELIPEGRVTSYGAIARYLGAPGSARVVGWAMNAVDKTQELPAHRVVNSQGVLTGAKMFDINHPMATRLEKEGITIKNNKVKDFKQVFWDPNLELL
jgi:methylated-DNA-protein-cysteine methyltransferase-like protein